MIQATLIAGAPSQSLSATWEQTHDSPGISAPVADTVQLWLINDAGDSAQFVPASGIGSYNSALPVLPGRQYRLRGTVGQTRVNDSTVIPGNVTITTPSRGDQAPRKPYLSNSGDGITIGSDPLFHLPPVPSIVLRGHWSPNN